MAVKRPTPQEIEEQYTDKEQNFTSRHFRMDEDFLRWSFQDTVEDIRIKKLTTAHASDVVIKSNDLRKFADGVQSKLSSSEKLISVTLAEPKGEDVRDLIGDLERLFYFAFDKADERLRRLVLPPLQDSFAWFSPMRGWLAGRFLVYKVKNNVIFDFVPYDIRWLAYEVGGEGFNWTTHVTFSTADAIGAKWGKEVSGDKNIKVFDHWLDLGNGKKLNSVSSGGMWLKEPKAYEMLSMPVLAMPVSTLPSIVSGNMDTGMELAGYGDSIFASARTLNSVRDRFASIVATQANTLANQALINYRTKKGTQLKTTTNVPGGVINLVKGEDDVQPSPMQEISPTTIEILGFLKDQLEGVMLPDVRINRPQPQSGTLENIIQEAGDRVFNPQIRNFNNFYSEICRLMEEQIITGKIGIDVKTQKDKKYYEVKITPVELKKAHITKVEFTSAPPWAQLSEISKAQMLQAMGIPDTWIFDKLLKISDPEMLNDLFAIQLYKKSPQGAMKEAVEALMKYGEVDAAQSVVAQMARMEDMEIAETQGVIQGTQEVLNGR